MREYNIADYTFPGLANHGQIGTRDTALAYMVALVDTPDCSATELNEASRILHVSFNSEDQQEDPSSILVWQEGALPRGFYPQTPVMLANAWSPMAAMLQHRFKPIVLRRSETTRAISAGVWPPGSIEGAKPIAKSKTDEELFWAIMSEASRRARERDKLICIIADTGWSVFVEEGALALWGFDQRTQADKILWKRTPRGRHLP